MHLWEAAASMASGAAAEDVFPPLACMGLFGMDIASCMGGATAAPRPWAVRYSHACRGRATRVAPHPGLQGS